MTDIPTLTRNAHAQGFERGSHVTLQTVMAYLDAHGYSDTLRPNRGFP